MRRSARRKPMKGESTIAIRVGPSPLHSTAPGPALAIAAPRMPPIRACEELEGMPPSQVTTFHTIAPTRAPKTTWAFTTSAATIPFPIVWATCVPKNRKATKLKKAAQNTAYWGRSTRVETMVAIEFAASCRPLRKSKSSATAMRPTRRGRPSVASMVSGRRSDVLDHDGADLVRHVLEAVDHLLEAAVDLVADHEGHGVRVPVRAKQRPAAVVVQVVGAALEMRDLLADLAQPGRVG